MASSNTNKQWVLETLPTGMVQENNFSLRECPMPRPNDGEVLLRSLWISVDPYMRGKMAPHKSFIGASFKPHEPISGNVIARVEESRAAMLGVGQLVLVIGPWQQWFTYPAEKARPIDTTLGEPQWFLGILGLTGLSAFFPVRDIAKPQTGDVAFVSGAAGAVGSVVGQLLKIMGCSTVVGSAGSDEKCAELRRLGFDHAFNYKTRKVGDALSSFAPDGIDIYWDNVGGQVLDETLPRMRPYGRIIACGSISQYNVPPEQQYGLRNWLAITSRQLKVQGFLVNHWAREFPAAIQQLSAWIRQGKLKNRETVVDGFDKLPSALVALFEGTNVGKLVVHVEN